MITLQKMNVVKIVDNEEAAAKLKESGFAVTSQDEAALPEVPAAAPPSFHCPQRDKMYKTQEGLDKHLTEKHPNTGGDGNGDDTGTGTGADSAGNQEQP